MTDWRVAGGALPGPFRSAPVVHVARGLKLVFYPGESILNALVADGKIYVVGGGGESYPACGGPPMPYGDRGHTAEPTPAGRYVLGPQHRHVTSNWTNSCLAYGTPLRIAADGDIEYQADGRWRRATGLDGRYTTIAIRGVERGRKTPLTHAQKVAINERARLEFFLADKVTFVDHWYKNDFGAWAWNLTQDGKVSPYYVHTTPDDETMSAIGAPVRLGNSHGCVHVRPSDRDEMIAKGYLKRGTVFEVMPYGDVGPP